MSENRKFGYILFGFRYNYKRLKTEQICSDFGVIYNRTNFTTERQVIDRNPNCSDFGRLLYSECLNTELVWISDSTVGFRFQTVPISDSV